MSHLKNSELEREFQKYKARVVPSGDIAKDNSGNHAVFTEQGASASHTTAALVLDVLSRLPGCSGRASCSERRHTSQHERRTRISSSFGKRLSRNLDPNTERKNGWSAICTVTHWLNSHGREHLKKVLFENEEEKVPRWECRNFHRKWQLVVSVFVDDIKDGRNNAKHAEDVGKYTLFVLNGQHKSITEL